MTSPQSSLNPNDRVRVSGRYELGIGEVLRVSEAGGLYVSDVVFESRALFKFKAVKLNKLLPYVSQLNYGSQWFSCWGIHREARLQELQSF